MSSGKNPLVWMVALTMPGAAQALGLGEIHVDSGLNERLAAEIDIVGATRPRTGGPQGRRSESRDLRCASAPIGRRSSRRPPSRSPRTARAGLCWRSAPPNPSPNPWSIFLVDLNWRNGQLVRQYTLLLDPAGFQLCRHPPPWRRRPAVAAAAPLRRGRLRWPMPSAGRRPRRPTAADGARPPGRPLISRSARKPRCAALHGA